MNADIIVNIYFFPTDKGGKKLSITGEWFGCPFGYEGEYYDCRIITKGLTPINPGDTIQSVPVAFLSPELVLTKLKENTSFTLWESGVKAEGKIIKIIKKDV